MAQRYTADLRILDPVADGEATVGDSLRDINTFQLPSGSFCFVENEVDGRLAGEWQFERFATDAPNGTTIIEPAIGPGRWFWKMPKGVGGGGGGGIVTITGSGGIAITAPAGPVTDVSGAALYARDGTNGGMTADVDMNGNDVTDVGAIVGSPGLILNGGVALTWPAADGAPGEVLTTDGAGNLSFSASSGGLPLITVQNIAVAGPTPITDTFNTHARVDTATIGAASSVTLPTGAVGKQITVKDSGGTASVNNITISPSGGGTIDGAASLILATDLGSKTMVCVATGPDVWDVV